MEPADTEIPALLPMAMTKLEAKTKIVRLETLNSKGE
jgi:hypothetical protein